MGYTGIMPVDRKHMEIRQKIWFNSYDIVFFFLKKCIYFYLCVPPCVMHFCHLCVSANRGQKAALGVPGLDLQAAMKHPV